MPRKIPFYKRVYLRQNLRGAWLRVRSNGMSSKSEQTRKSVLEFEKEEYNKIEDIRKELKERKFKFSPSEGVLLQGKRPIVIAPVINRIVQRSILDVLQSHQPIKKYIEISTSFGGIGERSVCDAVRCAHGHILNGKKYFIRSDIKKFFTKIPKAVVIDIIKKSINDAEFTDLLSKAVDVELKNMASLGEKKDLFPLYDVGVAQGCCLSPLLGNILLNEFDQMMNDRGIVCLRYIDDFLLLGENQKNVFKAFNSAQKYLSKFDMDCYDPSSEKHKAECGNASEGFNFLGCEISPKVIRPNKASCKRLVDTIDTAFKKSISGMANPEKICETKNTFVETLYRMNNVIKGWGNQYSFCNDKPLFQKMDEQLFWKLKWYTDRFNQRKDKLDRKHDRKNVCRIFGVHLITSSKHQPIISS